MKYTVVWKASAEAELAAIWSASSDRSAISSAADSIDQILRNDPVLRGETYTRTTRVLPFDPLFVLYRVFEDDRIVRVLMVRRLLPSEQCD